jgi:hypothetical protein
MEKAAGEGGLEGKGMDELEELWVGAKVAERESCEPTSQKRDVGHPADEVTAE